MHRYSVLVAIFCGTVLGRPAIAKEFLGINLGPTPSEFPTRSFRDDISAEISGALLLKYNASEARVVAAQWFQAARDYLPSAAAGNPLPPVDINVAIANSAFANMTQASIHLGLTEFDIPGSKHPLPQTNINVAIADSAFVVMTQAFPKSVSGAMAGTALSTFLPDHINNDSFMSNYSQAMIPGLVTGLTGIRYAPCLLRSSAVGAAAGATGVIFNPSLFAARPTGAALTATGLRLSPALLLIAPSATPNAAFGGLVAPSLITVVPTHVSIRDAGFQANPALIKINSSPNVPLTGPDAKFNSPPPELPGGPPGGSPAPGSNANSNSGNGGAEAAINPGVSFTFPSAANG